MNHQEWLAHMERKIGITHNKAEDVVDKMENLGTPCMDFEI